MKNIKWIIVILGIVLFLISFTINTYKKNYYFEYKKTLHQSYEIDFRITDGTKVTDDNKNPIAYNYSNVYKFSINGDLLWNIKADVNKIESVTEVNGKIYVVAYKIDNDRTIGTILALDKDGNILWEKVYDQGDNTKLEKIIKTTDNSILTIGTSKINNIVRILISKIDCEGNEIFTKIFQVNNFDYGNIRIISLKEVSNQYIVLLSYDTHHTYIFRYNHSGELKHKDEIRDNYTTFHNMIVLNDGGYAILAYDKKPIIMKYDNNFNLIWEKTLLEDFHGSFKFIQETSNNELIVIGNNSTENYGVVIKYDYEGKKLYHRYITHENNTYYTDFLIDDEDTLYIYGVDNKLFLIKYELK